MLWSSLEHGRFFLVLSGIAAAAAALLLALDRPTRRIEAVRALEPPPASPEPRFT
jgi:hypothetical protein